MNSLLWAGALAGALASIGAVLRWTVGRLFRFGRWAAAISDLPAAVDQLAHAVDQLAERVDHLHQSTSLLES